jgi:glyoxalase family protein
LSDFVTEGFHHVTLVAHDARRTLAFYRDILGFPLVKRTVNFDLPTTYHLYFGLDGGKPGTIVTVFEWPDSPRGAAGVGGVHHHAFAVSDQAQQLKWKRWLQGKGVPVSGPYDRGWFTSIYFTDPDGQVLEIATVGPGFDLDEPIEALGRELIQPNPGRLVGGRDEAAIRAMNHPEPVEVIDDAMRLHGIHHVTGFTDDLVAANEFYERALGMRLVKKSVNQDDPDTLHYFWANYDGTRVLPASDLTLFGWPKGARPAREGTGQTHHIAFRARDEEQLGAWREHLREQSIGVTEIRDRTYFKSIYFRSPDGLLHEIATDPPGFALDEAPDHLGEELRLPPWLEAQRDQIAANLRPLEASPAGRTR